MLIMLWKAKRNYQRRKIIRKQVFKTEIGMLTCLNTDVMALHQYIFLFFILQLNCCRKLGNRGADRYWSSEVNMGIACDVFGSKELNFIASTAEFKSAGIFQPGTFVQFWIWILIFLFVFDAFNSFIGGSTSGRELGEWVNKNNANPFQKDTSLLQQGNFNLERVTVQLVERENMQSVNGLGSVRLLLFVSYTHWKNLAFSPPESSWRS